MCLGSSTLFGGVCRVYFEILENTRLEGGDEGLLVVFNVYSLIA